MNHLEEAKAILCAYIIDSRRQQEADDVGHAVDHIIAAAVEVIEERHLCPECTLLGMHSPGCDEAPKIDPDMPRRFRWRNGGTVEWRYGCYFPQYSVNHSGAVERAGTPGWPVEWIDPEPT